MQNTLIKGIITTVVALLATTITTTGLPTTVIGWETLGITTIGIVLTQLAHEAKFPSRTVFGNLDLRDLIAAGITAAGTALSSITADTLTGTAIDWQNLLKLTITMTVAAMAKLFISHATPKP